MIIPVDFAQANFRYGGNSYPLGAEWTLGLKVDAFTGDIEDMLDQLTIAHNAFLRGLQSNDCLCEGILLKLGPNATGAASFRSVNTVGLVAQSAEAPAVAILVRKVTALGGRKGRGRLFFPGAAHATFGDGGVMSGADVIGVNDAFEDFRTTLIGVDLVPALLHADATTPVPIIGFSCQGTAATQRRRQRR